MSILLTGFNGFGSVAVNPSQVIVEAMEEKDRLRTDPGLVTKILPTEFDTAENMIAELILQHKPKAVLALGVAGYSPYINLERVALNLDDTDTPDNKGELRSGIPIVSDGPVAYLSTLPLNEMRESWKKSDSPADISNHAGTYVCNHVFYVARHEIEKKGMDTKCGFIHVPMIYNKETPAHPIRGLPLDVMIKGVELCLSILGYQAA